MCLELRGLISRYIGSFTSGNSKVGTRYSFIGLQRKGVGEAPGFPYGKGFRAVSSKTR